MGTETEHLHHQQTHAHRWSCPDLPSDQDESEDTPISQIMDHGSISFGRYEIETLAWEKFSVFSHNSRQEELEKFKAPGLVAQKKAYFEEYYKKIRAMKALEEKQQETTQAASFQDGQDSITPEESGFHADTLKKENKPSSARQIQISDNDTPSNLNPSRGGIVDEKERKRYFSGNRDRTSIAKETGVPVSSMKKASPSYNSLIKSRSETAQRNSRDCNKVEHRASQPRKQAPATRTMGILASAANKTKLDSRIRKEVVKPSEKPKPYVPSEITSKAGDSLVSGKRITPKAASNNTSNPASSCIQRREVQCSANVLHTSSTKDKKVSPSSNIRGGPLKAYSSPKGLANNLPATLSVLTRSVQTTSKEINTISHLRKLSLDNRSHNGAGEKSVELSGQHRGPKSGESGNQRPKTMLTNDPARNKSNQNIGPEVARISTVKGVKQRKGKNEIDATIGRDPRPSSSKVTSIHKASNPILVLKVAPSRSVDLTHDRRDSRYETSPLLFNSDPPHQKLWPMPVPSSRTFVSKLK